MGEITCGPAFFPLEGRESFSERSLCAFKKESKHVLRNDGIHMEFVA